MTMGGQHCGDCSDLSAGLYMRQCSQLAASGTTLVSYAQCHIHYLMPPPPNGHVLPHPSTPTLLPTLDS